MLSQWLLEMTEVKHPWRYLAHGNLSHISFISFPRERTHEISRLEGLTKYQGSKNICGNTHTCSWTVRTSSINLPNYHLSISLTSIQMPTIHSSPTHHPFGQTSIHPSLTIYVLSIIVNSSPTCYPSTYPPSYTHPSSISLSSIHPFHQPASHRYSICLSTYHVSITHLSTIHQPLTTNRHLSFIHQFLIHPLFIHLFIYLFLIHPPIIPIIIIYFIISSIHRTYVPYPFLHIYRSSTSRSWTHQLTLHPFLFHSPSILHSLFH